LLIRYADYVQSSVLCETFTVGMLQFIEGIVTFTLWSSEL